MAGLILIDGDTFHNTPLLDEAGIFRAAVMSRKVDSLNCPIVFPDMTGMVDVALDTLVSRGRTRIATLTTVGVHSEVGNHLRQALQKRGITSPDRWHQIVPHDVPEAVRNNVLMMMAGADRPDGLFIVDDNLVEGGVFGLGGCGCQSPQRIINRRSLQIPRLRSPRPPHAARWI